MLRIENATVSGSTSTSAIKSEGTTELRQVIIQDNIAGTAAAVLMMPGGHLDAISAVFANNTAENNGGAVFCMQDNTLSFENTAMSGNSVTGSGKAAEGGGLLAIRGCSVVFKGRTTFSNNHAQVNGGVLLVANANVTIRGSLHASGNSALQGGVVSFWEGGSVTIEHGVFFKNKAKRDGGLVSIVRGGNFVCADCTITGQEAGANGWVRVHVCMFECVPVCACLHA